MAVDMFMKIDDIKGESSDNSHKDEIDVMSWQWGIAQIGSSQIGGGSGAGKASVNDLTFVTHVEKSTAPLLKMSFAGTSFKKAQLVMRKAGGKPLEYMKIVMSNGLISNVSLSGSGSDTQMVTVSLNFGKVDITYTPQAPDGSPGADISASLDISGNQSS